MSRLSDLGQAAARLFGNMALASGASAAGTGAGTIKTTATIPYLVDGQFYSKAATDNIALAAPTPDQYRLYSIGAAEAARTFYLVFALDSAGNVKTIQGSYSGQDLSFRGGGIAKGDGLIPDVPADLIPFAIAKVQNPANLAFVPGTTALTTASGRTVTFYNVGMLPAAVTL